MIEDVLPLGHRARRPAAVALWGSLVCAVAFVAFAWITTQVHAVRVGSPWQDDPYDVVVSFTEFLVPALAALIVARVWLCRRDKPLPLFRVVQLMRAGVLCTMLVTLTVTADWLAVVLRADHALWNDRTPWLIAALVPLTGLAVVCFALQRRAFRGLPSRATGSGGDWLDDMTALMDGVAARFPGLGRLLAWTRPGEFVEFIRRHIMASAAALSLAASMLVTTALALGEHWSSQQVPLLLVLTVTGTGGYFAFCMISNTILEVATPPSRQRSWAAHAIRMAVIAGSLAMPVSTGLRDSIWAALGHDGPVSTVAQLATITFGTALVAGMLTFAGTACLRGTMLQRELD